MTLQTPYVKDNVEVVAGPLTLDDLALLPKHAAILAHHGATTIAGLLTFNPNDLPAVLGNEGEAARVTALINAHGLQFRSVTRAPTFIAGLNHMAEFISAFGHARPKRRYDSPDGYRLGLWVMALRQSCANNEVPPARRWILSTLPGWTWDPIGERRLMLVAEKAETTLANVTEFTDERDLTTISTSCKIDGERLHNILASVREAENFLTAEHHAAFTALPGWTWDESEARACQAAADDAAKHSTVSRIGAPLYDRFVKYVERTGSAAPKAAALDEDGFAIGRWVIQRRQRRHIMRQVEHDLLESLPGWSWDGNQARTADSWERWITRLEMYVAEHATADVPMTFFTEQGDGLGKWVRQVSLGDFDLTGEQKKFFAALPGWKWRTLISSRRGASVGQEAKWNGNFEAYKAFVHEHGRLARSLEKDSNGVNVGSWATSQRSAHRAGTLPMDRLMRMEAEIPRWTWTPPRGNPQTNRYSN